MNLRSLERFLSRTAIFGGLPEETIAALAQKMRPRELANGEALIQQGQPGDSLFLVIDGRLEARLSVAATPPQVKALGRIGRGEVVGEMAVLSGAPRLCSIVAIRESRVLELARADFQEILARHPDSLVQITYQIIRRARAPVAAQDPVATVGVIPASPRVEIDRFSEALVAALSEWGSVGLLRPRDVLGPTGNETLNDNLSLLEQEHDRVVYQGLHWGAAWSRRVVRQADLILVVADADDDAALSDFERDALFCERPLSAARVDLVLLHRDRSAAPRGSARWLQHRRPRLHHHVALGAAGDFARLSRLITGNSVHLILSGGGARGFGHIGVMRALDEAGIPIDFVGGTSMGAGMAAFRAMEWPAARVVETMHRHLASGRDLTLPVLSLFAGKKGTRALQAMFGEQQIEDLWLNYFAVSADLQHAEEFVHRRGPLWLAQRASTSMPGIYPPVILEGRCLIDGGALNNLPVDVMAGITPGRIIAVDVSQEHAVEFAAHHPMMISGWELLWRRLNPFRRAPRDPHIADVLARAGEIAAVRIRRASHASTQVALTITPPVTGYRTLDLSAIDTIVDVAYRHACEHVEGWKAALSPRAL